MILCLDTSGTLAVVAVADPDGHVHFAATGTGPRAHGEQIGPLVADAQAIGPIDHVVVGRGPGSFTGLRVGLAFGQIWAWARGVPITGICSLDIVAEQFGLVDGWAVTDARRREVFVAQYAHGLRVDDPVAVSRGAAAELTAGSPVVGDVDLLTSTDRRQSGQTVLDPTALGRVAARAVATDPLATIQPDYLRRPDVTMSAANRGAP